MEDAEVLTHGLEDAESVVCHCCPVSRNLSSSLSLEANAILQSLGCVHPRERGGLGFSASWLYPWISLHRLKLIPG